MLTVRGMAARMQQLDQVALTSPKVRRIEPSPGSAKVLEGPFKLAVTFANGSLTDIDLAAQSVWYHDHAVRLRWGIQDSSTPMEAVLQVDALALLIDDDALLDAAASAKSDFLLDRPYAEWSVNGIRGGASLAGAVVPMLDGVAKNNTTADTTSELHVFDGEVEELSRPVRINLRNSEFRLKTEADVGAAYTGYLLVYGALGEVNANSEWIDGCAAEAAGTGLIPQPVRDVQSIAQWRASKRRSRRFARRGG